MKDKNITDNSSSEQATIENGTITIEETFIATGVNVNTGDVMCDGAVIINGDVTENMKVIAKGDVTINGYVESAFIQSQGDIMITQGATGKMHDEDCQLIAKGSVYINHAQGTDIIAGKNVYVVKQLAYSRVNALGSVIVGSVDNPMGNMFASKIHCGETVHAGSLGALSGSALLIDFSKGYNLINDRLESITSLYGQLLSSNAIHEEKFTEINDLKLREIVENKIQALNDELDSERLLLLWLKETLSDLQDRKQQYENNMLVIANKDLFPGVTLRLNKISWSSEQEYSACKISHESGNWENNPLL